MGGWKWGRVIGGGGGGGVGGQVTTPRLHPSARAGVATDVPTEAPAVRRVHASLARAEEALGAQERLAAHVRGLHRVNVAHQHTLALQKKRKWHVGKHGKCPSVTYGETLG